MLRSSRPQPGDDRPPLVLSALLTQRRTANGPEATAIRVAPDEDVTVETQGTGQRIGPEELLSGGAPVTGPRRTAAAPL
jgi:hypothetical protein